MATIPKLMMKNEDSFMQSSNSKIKTDSIDYKKNTIKEIEFS
jgi:hypothetical protein